MAINKDRIVQLLNNRAVPANQPLPPSDAGLRQVLHRLCLRCRQGQGAARRGRFSRRLRDRACSSMNTDPQSAHRPGDPAGPGGRRRQGLDPVAGPGQRHRRRRRPDGAPMIWSGGMAWIADFPDPSNFYGPILGCGGAVQGGWNWSWYCNKDLDEGGRSRLDVRSGQGRGARQIAWGDIYAKIMADAPWAPVFNEQRRHHEVAAHGWRRQRSMSIRSISHQLRLCVQSKRCAIMCVATPSTDAIITSAGTTRLPRPSGWRPARRSSSNALTRRRPAQGRQHGRRRSPSSTSSKINPVTGSDLCRRALKPGDALKVTIRCVQTVRLRLDGEHSRLRPARRRLQGAGAQHLEIRRRPRSSRRCSAKMAACR
jgi:hypothetical protein